MTRNENERLKLALLSLAREVWVLKDRQGVLERCLEDRGVVARDLLERHQPDAAAKAASDAELSRFLDAILAELAAD